MNIEKKKKIYFKWMSIEIRKREKIDIHWNIMDEKIATGYKSYCTK